MDLYTFRYHHDGRAICGDMRDLRGDLLHEFRKDRVLIVVGSGVSLAATRGNPVAGWPGLLRSGLEHLLMIRKVEKEWADRRFEEIRRGDVARLVEVAQEVRDAFPPAEYRLWLEDSVGSLQAKDPSVILALAGSRRRSRPPTTTT